MSELTRRDAARLQALHWLARAALRLRSPLQAKALVDGVASRLRRLDGIDDARAAVRELFPAGSCLSRALAIAAALPRAHVVIGVYPPGPSGVPAHAWIEIDSVCVDTRPGDSELPEELTRLSPTPTSPQNGLSLSNYLSYRKHTSRRQS
jgi:hypothetical protein